jgi:hypothetical protein
MILAGFLTRFLSRCLYCPQAALSAFVGQLDKGPEGGRRVVDALSAAGEGSCAAGGGFEADVMQLARSMM